MKVNQEYDDFPPIDPDDLPLIEKSIIGNTVTQLSVTNHREKGNLVAITFKDGTQLLISADTGDFNTYFDIRLGTR